MENYSDLKKRKYVDTLEIRLKYQKDCHVIEFFDGVRVNPDSIPEGKHMYHTRHADNDWSQPVAIAPEGKSIIVNFCGTIVTDQKFDLREETKIMYVSWL